MTKFFSLLTFLLITAIPDQTFGYYIQSEDGTIPGIGSIENLDNIIASAAQSSPFSFALPLPLSMMGSSMSQLLSSPAMALNRLRSANQPVMIEIPNHVLNDFNADPQQYQVMPLHKCKYCSGSKGNSGGGGSGLKGPARYMQRQPVYQQMKQQYYGKSRPQVNQYPVKSSGGGGGYKRPVQQQPIHQYPTKGGYSNKMPNNQKIVVVVLHMKNDKYPAAGTKGSGFSRGDQQQQQIVNQMRYAAPSTTNNHPIYFEPLNQRFNAPTLTVTAAAAPTAKPDNSGFSNGHSNFNSSPLSDRPARGGDSRSSPLNTDDEIITQTKEDDSSYSPTTASSVRF